ncbi:MAG: glycosyltransferase family 4 protein [Acetobacteraceae bacterium]|nr:glycosyltransferase family 4 protein [Acetobacteraceae bacterium]
MKIGLVSSAVPLVFGGGRFIVDWLREKLEERGHRVEAVFVPSTENPDNVLQQMAAFRMMRLEDYFERVVTFRPPSHVVRHPRKVVWFIHHMRVFYDLWDTPYRGMPDRAPQRALRAAIIRADTAALREAHRVFTNSRVVGDRLRRFNGVGSDVLYPPVLRPEIFVAGDHGDEIVCVCRVESHKRQHLLVEAMRHVCTPVRLRLCGTGTNPDYVRSLRRMAAEGGAADRVVVEDRWITEEEKAAFLRHALASAYVPFDEDSYGYPTIEAAHARRCTVTVSDAGGVSEFVQDGVTGLVAAPEPAAVAAAFDRLHADRALARRLGADAAERVAELGIDWGTVVEKLLA